jgi:hypothetical protein
VIPKLAQHELHTYSWASFGISSVLYLRTPFFFLSMSILQDSLLDPRCSPDTLAFFTCPVPYDKAEPNGDWLRLELCQLLTCRPGIEAVLPLPFRTSPGTVGHRTHESDLTAMYNWPVPWSLSGPSLISLVGSPSLRLFPADLRSKLASTQWGCGRTVFPAANEDGLAYPVPIPHEASSAPISTWPLSSSRIFSSGPHLLSRMRGSAGNSLTWRTEG